MHWVDLLVTFYILISLIRFYFVFQGSWFHDLDFVLPNLSVDFAAHSIRLVCGRNLVSFLKQQC